MKSFVSIALLSLIAASAAQAEVKLETRTYHANLHLDGGKSYLDGEYDGKVHGAFFNTAGVGAQAVFSSTDLIDLGIGYGIARFYTVPDAHLDLQSTSGFARFNFMNSESGTFYLRTGLTSQDLNQHVKGTKEAGLRTNQYSDFSKILNWDAGIGGAVKLGRALLGLEYTYSNTLDKGHVTFTSKTQYLGLAGNRQEISKLKIKGVTAETQEVALTLGVRI